MLAETRESRARFLQTYERHARRRHHTLDNGTLDKFNFICVPLHIDENQTNIVRTNSNDCLLSKSKENSSPIRRVRFKFDENQPTNDIHDEKRFSVHRVEYQIPIQKDTINLNTNPTIAKTRSITSQKIDIHFNNTPSSINLSTVDSNHQQTQWYKDMYGQIHKSPEKKKDQIQNPYKPTYTFPEEFDGNFDKMEQYMRRAASEDIEETANTQTLSSVKTDHQPSLSNTNQTKTTTDIVSSSITINPNSSSVRPVDSEHRNVYKRILRGGDIPSTGLQKISVNNRDKSSEKDVEQITRSNNFQPISKALALHNFYAQTNRELSFKKGDTILVKRRINDDWLEGEYQGKMGIFPVNHVELFPYENTDGEAIVKYDFLAKQSNELTLKKDEKVILVRKLEHNWYEGRINQRQGIFPADHIEIIREPTVKTLKSVLKTPSNNLQQTSIEKINIVPDLTLPLQRCQVLYDYTPKNTDELEIHVGDIIKILEMCDDGWYCGIMEKTNHNNVNVFGTFPGNYVKILPM